MTVTLATSPLSEEQGLHPGSVTGRGPRRDPQTIAPGSGDVPLPRPVRMVAAGRGPGETAVDSSGNGHDARSSGERGPKWSPQHPRSRAEFDGKADYVETDTSCPDLAMPFTITLWVNPAATQVEYADIFGNHGEPSVGVSLQQHGGRRKRTVSATATASAGRASATCSSRPASGSTSRSSATAGRPVLRGRRAEGPGPRRGPAGANPGQNFKLGQGYHTGRYFHGLLGDVRIYSKALSAAEVAAVVACAATSASGCRHAGTGSEPFLKRDDRRTGAPCMNPISSKSCWHSPSRPCPSASRRCVGRRRTAGQHRRHVHPPALALQPPLRSANVDGRRLPRLLRRPSQRARHNACDDLACAGDDARPADRRATWPASGRSPRSSTCSTASSACGRHRLPYVAPKNAEAARLSPFELPALLRVRPPREPRRPRGTSRPGDLPLSGKHSSGSSGKGRRRWCHHRQRPGWSPGFDQRRVRRPAALSTGVLLDRLRPGIELVTECTSAGRPTGAGTRRASSTGAPRPRRWRRSRCSSCTTRSRGASPTGWEVRREVRPRGARLISYNYGAHRGRALHAPDPVRYRRRLNAAGRQQGAARRDGQRPDPLRATALNTFAFARGATGKPLGRADLVAFAEQLIPGQGELIVAGWEHVESTDAPAMCALADRLEHLSRGCSSPARSPVCSSAIPAASWSTWRPCSCSCVAFRRLRVGDRDGRRAEADPPVVHHRPGKRGTRAPATRTSSAGPAWPRCSGGSSRRR